MHAGEAFECDVDFAAFGGGIFSHGREIVDFVGCVNTCLRISLLFEVHLRKNRYTILIRETYQHSRHSSIPRDPNLSAISAHCPPFRVWASSSLLE